MAKLPKSYRLDEDLAARLGAYASERDVSETVVVESALASLLDARGSVPGLRVVPGPGDSGLQKLMLSSSQVASLDQTAARWGVSRVGALERIVRERVLKEFVDERNRQAFDKQPRVV